MNVRHFDIFLQVTEGLFTFKSYFPIHFHMNNFIVLSSGLLILSILLLSSPEDCSFFLWLYSKTKEFGGLQSGLCCHCCYSKSLVGWLALIERSERELREPKELHL